MLQRCHQSSQKIPSLLRRMHRFVAEIARTPIENGQKVGAGGAGLADSRQKMRRNSKRNQRTQEEDGVSREKYEKYRKNFK